MCGGFFGGWHAAGVAKGRPGDSGAASTSWPRQSVSSVSDQDEKKEET